MNKRKSVVDGEQAQSCKKPKLEPLDDAPDTQALDTGTTSSALSSSAAPKVSASASASSSSGPASANAATSEAHGAHGAPAPERRNKRKAADDANSSQAHWPEKKRIQIDWENFDLEAFEALGRGKSPPKLNFEWKRHVYKPRPPPTPFQQAFRNAPNEVRAIFAAWPQTDSEDERERNGLPSPGSSVNGDAVQQPAAAPAPAPAPGAHYLISIPRPAPQPAPQPEEAAGPSKPNTREPMARHASVSGITQGYSPSSRSSSASPPPRWMGASSSRPRLNKGKAPATRSGTETRHAPQSSEKQMPPLDKRKKKKTLHGHKHRKDQDSGPHAKHLEGFLLSTRSSRRGGKCELWYLGDDGVATRSVNKK
ncbi:hypothetical protein MKX07_004464 [Trichoderma sp. CBMAI-0711]|nr:hypothetical protein MKX07_004464 [Trichoderma sp. CBMAI-0711]